jgi:transcriptional antiterminator RfaH
MQSQNANWFAVVTKPRQEHVALENLERQGYECFLPMAENPYQRRSKKNQLLVEPLFPRYMFLHAVAEVQNLAPVRSTLGVVSMVRFGTELAVVPDSVIDSIRSRMDPDTGLVKISPVPIAEGDKVKVFDGPLAGVEGIVAERNGNSRAILLMELLGRPTRVEIDPMLLQRKT